MRYLLIAVTMCCLGCAPRVVNVPVIIPCVVPPAPEKPYWPIQGLTGKETYGEVIRAFGATIEAEHGYAQQLESLLNGMR
jgi:hypothetical protein